MDSSERARYKQLANDSIIATFGRDDNEAQLAQALERCLDELEDANDKCPTCSVCENHGDHIDESIDVDVNEVLRIHGDLKKQVQAFKDYHVELSGNLAQLSDTKKWVEPLVEIIEETEGYVNELEAEVLP